LNGRVSTALPESPDFDPCILPYEDKSMIMSRSKTSGKGKNEETREKAVNDFNSDNKVVPGLRSQLMNATVRISYRDLMGVGTGVILNADPDPENPKEPKSYKAYVLTAKHLLSVFTKKDQKVVKPKDIVTTEFIGNLKIWYAPKSLAEKDKNLGKVLANGGGATASVSAINYIGGDGDTWNYDIMTLEIDDEAFHAYVTEHRFLPSDVVNTYNPRFKPRKVGGCEILDTKEFIYLQMGYGLGKDPSNPKETENSDDLGGMLQCRWTQPQSTLPAASAVIVESKKKVVADNVNVVLVDASKNSSTFSGDSGGPLFALPLKLNEQKTFYLVGVALGGNLETAEECRVKPASARADYPIFNNAVTYWDTFYNAWTW
jgi:hypothetical protein